MTVIRQQWVWIAVGAIVALVLAGLAIYLLSLLLDWRALPTPEIEARPTERAAGRLSDWRSSPRIRAGQPSPRLIASMICCLTARRSGWPRTAVLPSGTQRRRRCSS